MESFISAAIVTYNDLDKVKDAYYSIKENTKRYPLKLYIIDNGSEDNLVDFFKDFDVTVIENGKNLGFGAAHNKALGLSLGKYHFIVNPDIEIKSDVLSDMVDFMEKNGDICLAMPDILNSDGTRQYLPKEIPTAKSLFLGRFSDEIRKKYVWADKAFEGVTDIDFCSGCFMCIKTDVFRELNGFDERYFMYLEDADLTLRAKKYGRVVINTGVSVFHRWERESSKKIKYLIIHICSALKFLAKRRSGKL
ncbi:MAG: glycosyltransferase family 2 protein [Clostridia bacterium]|nr:glycosyltransferase family 2 protein [Clostridia bacterium]